MNRAAKKAALLLIPAAIMLAGTGCVEKQSAYLRDGKAYGVTSGSFSGRWWNFYERGRSFADGRFYVEAVSDFESAIRGRGQDQWRARTYGMHFVDYFPHRELGIVYFQREEYDRAISELEHSIETAPSAKAHYFLNKARAARIERIGQDQAAPELQLEGSSEEVITNSLAMQVSGVASDDTYVASVRVGAHQVYRELAEQRFPFSADVSLSEGENRIRVVATDLAGKSSEKGLNIYCDRRGPQIGIASLTVANNRLKLQGSISDDKGLRSVRINGQEQPLFGHPPGYEFNLTVPVGLIRIEAFDSAGNVTRAIVNGEEPDQRQAGTSSFAGMLMAYLPNAEGGVASDVPLLLASAPPPPADTDPPFIRLEGIGPEEETCEDLVLLEGMVSDDSQLASITINGEPVLNRKGKKIYFSVLKQLAEGSNEFRIKATDEHGNTMAKKVLVTRRIEQIRQIGSRMSVAVLPFEQRGDSSRLGDLVHDQIIDSFLEQARFNIVERTKLDALLRELKLSSTELVDPEQAARLGKIVAAQGMLAGSVIETPDSVEIIGRLIDTETATVLASHDIFGEDKGLDALGSLLDGLAFKFKRDFPLVEGIILEVRRMEVLIDAGSEKRIKPNTWLLCYREKEPIRHPVTGRLLRPEPRIISRLKVEEVYGDFSKTAVLDQTEALMATDRVISQ